MHLIVLGPMPAHIRKDLKSAENHTTGESKKLSSGAIEGYSHITTYNFANK